MVDFTLSKYCAILDAGLAAGYNLGAVTDLFEGKLAAPFIVLRHDVDRRPQNSLDMAIEENKRGVRASYYFRSVKASHDPDIITAIRDLGHEIGYHYEDWAIAKFNVEKGRALFEKHVDRLRDLAEINTICMHGSPLSAENNMNIWNHISYEDYGLKDCILSYDYTDHAFFTDSGRTFGVSGANLRDELGNADIYPEVKSTDDLCKFLTAKGADKIMVSVHPERWTDKKLAWTTQAGKDQAVNAIKHGIRMVRK